MQDRSNSSLAHARRHRVLYVSDFKSEPHLLDNELLMLFRPFDHLVLSNVPNTAEAGQVKSRMYGHQHRRHAEVFACVGIGM